MRGSVQETGLRTIANDLRGDSPRDRMPVKAGRTAVTTLVRDAMARTGLSQKAMAANAGVAESVLSEALAPHGTRHLALEWLWAQDDEFLAVLVDRLTEARGLTDQSRREAKAARVSELIRLILEVA